MVDLYDSLAWSHLGFTLQAKTEGSTRRKNDLAMSMRPHHVLGAIGLATLLSACALAQAADPVADGMQAAYAPHRMALFKTNGKSQAEVQQALTQAQQAWDRLSRQFGATPAAPYDHDPAFAATVAEVAKVYTKAVVEINANQLTDAHNTLEHAREVMADVRQRNNVVVFSDHMNEYHGQMELIVSDGSATLAQPRGLLTMTAQAGALSYLAKRLSTQAPVNLTQNSEFTALIAAVNHSVGNLEAALLNQDIAAVKDAIGKLKAPYSRLFAKFG
jgi:hypothetical protein